MQILITMKTYTSLITLTITMKILITLTDNNENIYNKTIIILPYNKT